MTDPARVPDPVAIARKLPQGAAIIYRHFGADDREAIALTLREITAARGQQLLIGTDTELALAVDADGVHFPRDAALNEPRKWRAAQPEWIITMAGIKDGEYLAELSGLDGLFVSSIFDSHSPSAGEPISPEALTRLCQSLSVPIYALGGITPQTAKRLIGTGAAGLAAIDGILQEIAMSEVEVEDTDRGHRLVIRREGHDEAEVTLVKVRDGVFNANHTGVPKSLGGQGIGKKLIEALSHHAREHNYKVIPGCPFVGAMWKRHPDWAEGVAAEGS